MKRSGFKPRAWQPTSSRRDRSAEFASHCLPTVQARMMTAGDVATASLVRAAPKPEACKPGKTAPTVAERDWLDRISALGCVACYLDGRPRTAGAVHHLLRGGRRIGHLHSICLCQPGHHMDGQQLGLISRHPWRVRFETEYATEAQLLAFTQAAVKSGHYSGRPE